MKNKIYFENKAFTPSKIICVGRNYAAHIEELGNATPNEPVIFLKPNSSISEILLSYQLEPLHYEGELSFIVIKSKLSGVGFGLDLTKRKTQQKLKNSGLPWERSKAFSGAAVLSEFIRLDNTPIESLSLKLEIDGQLVQQGEVKHMLFRPEVLLDLVQKEFSLEDGDIIMTGTPKGVGRVQQGSYFKGSVYSDGKQLLNASWLAS